jgi:integrase
MSETVQMKVQNADMAAPLPHIEVDKKSGRLSYRRVYPEPLRPHIPGHPVQLKRSLGATRPVKNPEVIERYLQFDAEWERNVRRARHILSGTGEALSTETITFLAETFARDWHRSDERSMAEKGGAWVKGARDAWDTHLLEFMEWRLEGDEQAMAEFWGKSARQLIEDAGVVHDPVDTPGFERLCRALNDKAIETSEALQARLKGRIVPVPPEPAAPVQREAQPGSTVPGQSFAAIVAEMLENPRYGVGASTKQACGTALRLWKEVHGDVTPELITKRMVTDWLDLLAKRPTGLSPSEQRMPLSKLVERFEGRDVSRMALKTQKQHLGMLAARWVKAQGEGYISDDLNNPFKRQMPTAARKEDPKEFSVAELTAMFSLPVFSLGERPKRGKGEASFWMPLIMLWTGTRPEEAAQLTIADFADGPEEGRWMMTITDQGEHPVKGDQNLKTSKRGSGRRTFPVPQALVDLNLRGYVEYLGATGETALFPKLRVRGARGHLFPSWSEWWSNYLRAHQVLPPGGGRKPSREFRHVWTTAARRSDIPEDAREYLLGHFRTGATANHGYGSKRVLGPQIDKLKHPWFAAVGVRPWRVPR